MHSGWPDRDRLLRKKREGIEMMSIKSLYEISEITVWRKEMIVFSWRSPSSPSSELSGKNGEDKVTGKRDGVIRELKKHEHGRLVKSYKPCSRSTRSWTFAYRRCMTNDVKLSDFAFYGGLALLTSGLKGRYMQICGTHVLWVTGCSAKNRM